MGTAQASVHPRTATGRASAAAVNGALGAPAVLPASSAPLRTGAGPMVADPALAERSYRASHPLAAPSWKAFRMYAGNHPNLTELKSVGVAGMIRGHRDVRIVLAVALSTLLIMLVALLAYWWLMPVTADADSPYAAAETTAPESTAVQAWKQGTIPSLYQTDSSWGAEPFGQGTIATAGAAPTALAMVHVYLTGNQEMTPVEFAHWGTRHDLTATGTDTIASYLEGAAGDYAMALEGISLDERGIRRALVSHTPVLVITQPGTFSPVASVIVLEDIDRDSHLVIHDPTSAARSHKSWEFEDVINAAAHAYEVHGA